MKSHLTQERLKELLHYDPETGFFTWDELQRIKGEIGLGSAWLVECYPPDREVVNVANVRHLWVLPEPPAFGWQRGRA